MKQLLYLILRKNIIKKLMLKHGDQFTNDVLKTFGLKEIPELKRSIRGNVLVDQGHVEDSEKAVESISCYTCHVIKGTKPKGQNYCSMCNHYF